MNLQGFNLRKQGKLALAIFATITAIFGSAVTSNSQITNLEKTGVANQPEITSRKWIRVRQIKVFKDHQAVVNSVVFTPDSQILIAGGGENDATLRFWQLKKEKKIQETRAQPSEIATLAVTSTGTTLISAGTLGEINLWNWKTGQKQWTFTELTSKVMSLAITPDNRVLVSGGLDGIKIWQITPQRPSFALTTIGSPSHALAIDPNGFILASGDNSGKIQFWNIKTTELSSELLAHERSITGIIFTPDGNTLITSSSDGTVKIWDLSSKQLLHTLNGDRQTVRAIALHPDGKTLATAGNNGIRIWDLPSGKLLTRIWGHRDWVQSVAFSPDGLTLATGGFDTTVRLWQSY